MTTGNARQGNSAKKKNREPEGALRSQMTAELIQDLIACKDLHVPAKNTTGYRNKMLYGLDVCTISELGTEDVNRVARRVFEWVLDRSAMPKFFWLDVSIKVTLDGTCMVKLAVDQHIGQRDSCEAAWEAEQDDFLQFLLQECPDVACVALHPSLRASTKPTKWDPFVKIYGTQGYVLEKTPNGVPFALSPDTFCEINHEMEAAVFNAIDTWCGRAAAECDRNSNSLAFGLMAKKGRFRRCFSITHCPLAQADLARNRELHPGVLRGEDCILAKSKATVGSLVMDLGGDGPVVVAVTAGRKGLHADTLRAFRENKRVCSVIYDACNHKTLTNDMVLALEGPRGYVIEDFMTFDFFPGTDYEASVTMLSRCMETLILPVGPAGTGKTRLSRHCLQRFPQQTCTHIERDAIFSEERGKVGSTLMGSKRATHQALIQGLCQWAGNGGVVVMDSTNGDEGARALYAQTMCAKRIFAVCFRPPEGGPEALVEGTDRRVAAEMSEGIHPSFPVDREDQIEKHRKILSGITFPQQAGLACLPGVQSADVLEHKGSDEETVRYLFRLIWCAVDPRVFHAGLR